jgi:hypothetical protein
MTHARACPKCGKIVEWTLDEPIEKMMPNGEVVPVRHARLICPEHGEFRNPAEAMALGQINSVVKRK